MNLLKFAAIDIGTNAARLLFSNVIEDNNDVFFQKSALIRIPLRLGEDVFKYEEIREQKISNLINTVKAFKHLIMAQEILSFKACATSAMREAKNGKELAGYIEKETGVKIHIINGEQEAEIIHTHASLSFKEKSSYLFIDVGGGSTEITVVSENEVLCSNSFKLGTIRILKEQVSKEDFKDFKEWVKGIKDKYNPQAIVGSGGNINKLFKISEKRIGKPLKYKELKTIYNNINLLSYEDRIKYMGLNPDRADVIIPAANIFLKIMKWCEIKEIIVPKIGVSDGIIRELYFEYKSGKKYSFEE